MNTRLLFIIALMLSAIGSLASAMTVKPLERLSSPLHKTQLYKGNMQQGQAGIIASVDEQVQRSSIQLRSAKRVNAKAGTAANFPSLQRKPTSSQSHSSHSHTNQPQSSGAISAKHLDLFLFEGEWLVTEKGHYQFELIGDGIATLYIDNRFITYKPWWRYSGQKKKKLHKGMKWIEIYYMPFWNFDLTLRITTPSGEIIEAVLQPPSKDIDTDGDGYADEEDAFPEDPAEWYDTDGDGVGDNSDPDIDGDGVPNEDDAFPEDDTEWSDLDNDGIGDNTDLDRDGDGVENDEDLYPDNPNEWVDSDGDGIGDNSDPDFGLGAGELANPKSGLEYRYYEGDISSPEDLEDLEPLKQGSTANIDLSLRETDGRYAIVFEGFLEIDEAAEYRFKVESKHKNMALLYINDELIAARPKYHSENSNARVYLEDGMHPIKLIYIHKKKRSHFRIKMNQRGERRYDLPDEWLWYDDVDEDSDGDGHPNAFDFYPHDASRWDLENPTAVKYQFDQESITLNWTPVEDTATQAAQTRVYRASVDGLFQTIATIPAIQQQFVDRDVSDGEGYRYWIRSINSDGFVSFEHPGVINVFYAINTAVITDFKVQLVDNEVEVSWQGEADQTFNIYRGIADGDLLLYGALENTNNNINVQQSFTDENISQQTKYVYQVSSLVELLNPFTGELEKIEGIGSTRLVAFWAKPLQIDIQGLEQVAADKYQQYIKVGQQSVQFKGQLVDAISEGQLALSSSSQSHLYQTNDQKFDLLIPVSEGNGQWTLAATTDNNWAQQSQQISIRLIEDKQAPVISLDQALSQTTENERIVLSGNVSDNIAATSLLISSPHWSQAKSITINPNGQFAIQVPVVIGDNPLTISASDYAGNVGQLSLAITREEVVPLTVTLIAPQLQTETDLNKLSIDAVIQTESALVDISSAAINGVAAQIKLMEENKYQLSYIDIPLDIGDNQWIIEVSDGKEQSKTYLNIKRIDSQSPVIVLENPASQVVDAATVMIKGTVTDNDSPISLSGSNDKFGSQTFGAFVQGDGSFNLQVPLEAGLNQLSIAAVDPTGNTTQQQISVERPDNETPQLLSIAPANNQTVTESTITVSGRLLTTQRAELVQVSIAGRVASITRQDKKTLAFSSTSLQLSEGSNDIQVDVLSPAGNIYQTIQVHYDPQVTLTGPVIDISSPVNDSQVKQSKIIVVGSVQSDSQLTTLTFKGETVFLSKQTAYQGDFQVTLEFEENAAEVSGELVATDIAGNMQNLLLQYQRDDLPPQIDILNNLAVDGSVNQVNQNPYPLHGTITDESLSSAFINGQNLSLVPTANENEYAFNLQLNLNGSDPLPVSIEAFDSAGNQVTAEFVLQNAAGNHIEIFAPTGNREFILDEATMDLQLTGRVYGASDTDTLWATIDETTPVLLTINQGFFNQSLPINASSGKHQLNITLKDAGQEIKAVSEREFSISNSIDIPLEVQRFEPARGSNIAEPGAPINLYFNKVIDPSKLEVVVKQTFHGMSYVDPNPMGTDSIIAEPVTYTEVHRDQQAVVGNVSMIPSNTMAAYYPTDAFDFGAQVFVDVKYENESLLRFDFKVRTLPTFIEGGLFDQNGNALANVEVHILELNKKSVTNSDGSFSFGYDDEAENVIKDGTYTFALNPNNKHVAVSSQRLYLTLQQGRRNQLGALRLPLVNKNAPYQFIEDGKTSIQSFANGAIKLDLNNVELTFPDLRDTGSVQWAQYASTDINMSVIQQIAPNWLFASQPAGIEVSGQMQVDLEMPPLYGSYDYLPKSGHYIILLGREPETNSLVPAGVAKVEGKRAVSVGLTHFKSLDYLGYALTTSDSQDILAAYANGEITIQQLISQYLQ
jgi:hypothetical protein